CTTRSTSPHARELGPYDSSLEVSDTNCALLDRPRKQDASGETPGLRVCSSMLSGARPVLENQLGDAMKQIHAGLVCLMLVILTGQATFTQQSRKPQFRPIPVEPPAVAQRQVTVPTSLSGLTAATQQPGRQLRSDAPGRRLVDGTSQLKARQE